ncbi:type II toxin-antitoxin system HicB family antitoxin [Cellulomonas timonensis]|uniref:type II toxin-antitoxin system HicB family antitoxin n=1 Tax=Cellulomonas timonensis TaxID=1689271 RepID=UPI0008371D02|nr:type II toxin-antitoxin system HicB family antitoxin [Cellulomonas timonensis]
MGAWCADRWQPALDEPIVGTSFSLHVRITWSGEDDAYVATVVEFPSLSWLDSDREGALHGVEALLSSVLNDLRANGEAVPPPLADRSYSGRFQVRVPPEVHRRLVTEAAEQGVSLNRLVMSRLAS